MEVKLSVRLIANTPETREKGLMFASPLAPNEAALFVFPHANRYAFWNKNVSFPLSLAFLDENGRVLDFADMEAQSTAMVEPRSNDVRFVVEAAKGTFDRIGVNMGDVIKCDGSTLYIKGQRTG